MNEGTATFNASPNTFNREKLSPYTLSVLGRNLRFFARLASMLLFGCFILVSLFVLQIAALEFSDRLDIFPLYGFFFANLLFGLLLTGFISISRKYSFLKNQEVEQSTSFKTNRLRRFWSTLYSILHDQKVKSQPLAAPKPVAVLLIIKRQASKESTPKSRAASA